MSEKCDSILEINQKFEGIIFVLRDELEDKIVNQNWKGVLIKAVEEGRGVFASKDFKKEI